MRLVHLLGPAALGCATLGGATSCELLTHAHDYEVAAPYQGFCNACAGTTADLRRPPCPTLSDVPDSGKEYVFAARQLYFAVDPAKLYLPSFDLGFDLDCSTRPRGYPVKCQAREVDGGTSVPWKGLPHGIDNSLVQRIFAPLYEAAAAAGQSIDINAQYTKQQEEGRIGFVLIVDNWNGTPDDPSVQVGLFLSPGVSDTNGAPRWDGTDHWDLYSDVPGMESTYFQLQKADGYVSGGILVVDYRARGDVSFRFGSTDASFRIIINQVIFAGALTEQKVTKFTMAAVADVASTYETVPQIAKVLSGCDPLGETYLNATLGTLLVGAADMPRDPSAPPDTACDGISFSWAFDAQPALLGGYKPEPTMSTDGGCL